MAGPHIQNIDLGPNWTGSFRFSQTNYRTVTVNVIDRSAESNKLSSFLTDLKSVGDQSSLVFTSSPGKAQNLMAEIIESGIVYKSTLGKDLGRWIDENYHREWQVGRGTSNGIAVHHGRLPRSLGQLFVRMFDEGHLKLLICTSTLIEGVNTSAANVFVFDKKINKTDFDFFSFANIRGRVGRMMRHFVGNAYLYHEPPAEIETRVNVPVLSDPDRSSDFIIMNVERAELSPAGADRQDKILSDSGLPQELLKNYGMIGVDLLVEVYDLIKDQLKMNPQNIIWSGAPDKEQRKALASLVLLISRRGGATGMLSAAQIGWAWSQLGKIQTFPKYLRWFAETFRKGDDSASGVDAAFQFLQSCEFAFPRSIAAVEALAQHAEPNAKIAYGPFIVCIENWYRPIWMKQLDEAGIPIPLAERLQKYIGPVTTRAEAINAIVALDIRAIPDFDDVDCFIVDNAMSVYA